MDTMNNGMPAQQAQGTAPAAQGLNAMVAQAAQLEAGVRAQSGTSLTWITLVDPSSNILVKEDKAYIQGAKMRDFVISSKKLILGEEFTATVLGMFKVYAEVQPSPIKGEMAKTVGYWHPDDAEMVPLQGYFDRPLNNGHVLQPVHWVFLYLHDHPEMEGVVLSFRSTGNKVYSQIEKLVKAGSTISPELRFKIGSQGIKAEAFNRTYYYPEFKADGQLNFKYDFEKGITMLEGGMGQAELETVIARYSDLQKAFRDGLVVARKGTAKVSGLLPGAPVPQAAAALPDAGETAEGGEEVRF